MSEPPLVLAVDVGGTRTKFGLVDRSREGGRLLNASIRPSAFSGTDEFIRVLDREANDLLRQASASREMIGAVGIGVPGFVDGDFISQVWDSLRFMEGSDFRPALERALHLPVALENDARAIALAEYSFGCSDHPERLLSLTLGTGIGFGFMVGGALHEKKPLAHMAAHILIRPGAEPCYCGLNGCLESLVNGRRLVSEFRRLRESGGGGDADLADAREILEAAVEQSASPRPGAALSAVSAMILDLIAGLNSFIYVFAPDVFVLGGGLAQGLSTFLPAIQQGLVAQPYRGFQSQVRISSLGEKAGLLGAAALLIKIPDAGGL